MNMYTKYAQQHQKQIMEILLMETKIHEQKCVQTSCHLYIYLATVYLLKYTLGFIDIWLWLY